MKAFTASLFCMVSMVTLIVTSLAFANFTEGEIYISSFISNTVRIYDAETLEFKSSFDHELFYGSTEPRGLAFNTRDNLVVATLTHLVEFSSPGIEFARYPKQNPTEHSEVITFDSIGNLYTTTSTGASNNLVQYRASDYAFEQVISLPVGAGSLTGITFDDTGRLFVASQSDGRIHVLQADPTFSTFTWINSCASQNPTNLEGLQFNQAGELIAAGGNITRYNPNTCEKLGDFSASNLAFPVPLRVDDIGRIYVADFEEGTGSSPADIFRFTPDGSSYISVNDLGLTGPFGLAIMECMSDVDDDGVCDPEDNCPTDSNPNQEDSYPPSGNACGDACECEGNFDNDDDQDGSDGVIFNADLGRTDCTTLNPCNGDFDCDGDVDDDDNIKFLEDFNRGTFNNPCPTNCVTEPWCVYDKDDDGVPDGTDNCEETPNGPDGGTCIAGESHLIARPCLDNTECGIDGFCTINQEDTDEDGIGDACEICEGDLSCDDKCDAIDVEIFLEHFGRSQFNRPCTNGDQCPGDFFCDRDVDADDVPEFLECLGRNPFNNPCLPCVFGPWCIYEE